MALPQILVTDFKGWVKIVGNQFKEVDLENYITEFREHYLRLIVGAGAFKDIEDQTRQKWTDLLDGVDFVDTKGERRYFAGLKKPLIYFIYFEFMRDNFTQTQPGSVKTLGENSQRSTDLEVLDVARSRYNGAVLIVNETTREFLETNKKFSESVTASVDNADNTYTLSIPSTKYLETDDSVTIDGTEYQVTAVTSNVDITIDAGQTGLDFSNDVVIWEPFEAVRFCELEPSGI